MSEERRMKKTLICQEDYDPYSGRRENAPWNPAEDCYCDVCAPIVDVGNVPTSCECAECRQTLATQFHFYKGTLNELIMALEDFRSKITSETDYEEVSFNKFCVGYDLYGHRPETDAEIAARAKREERKLIKKKKQIEKLQKELADLQSKVPEAALIV